jgi:hypothetical protein
VDPNDIGDEAGELLEVSKWKESNLHKHNGKLPDYVFVAYTGAQFKRWIPSMKDDTDQAKAAKAAEAAGDTKALHKLAALAAKEAGVKAYWIGINCMEKGEGLAEDVFRISDVVRGAHSLAIIVGPGPKDPKNPDMTPLQQFGMRLWTLPEILLSTPHQPIQVWHRGNPTPLKLSKTQLAPQVWIDVHRTRQLVDHYEGNLALSRLELVIIALKSLFARETAETYLPVSHSLCN